MADNTKIFLVTAYNSFIKPLPYGDQDLIYAFEDKIILGEALTPDATPE